jgi:dienelactone hydrolase
MPENATSRWERRFRAPSVTLPSWAPSEPDRLVFSSNETGSWQLYSWERRTGERRAVTDDPVGVTEGAMLPDGSGIVWFHDATGNEYGHYMVTPFGGGHARPLIDGIPDGWPSGLSMVGTVIAIAQGERDGFAIYISTDRGAAREVHRHPELVSLGGVGSGLDLGGLSADGSLLCYEHAEGGNLMHTDLRVIEVASGETVGELSDGADRGVTAFAWSPVAGDQRIAFRHELEDRERPGIWNPVTGERTNLRIDGSGTVNEIWGWWTDASAILVSQTTDARDSLLRVDVSTGSIEPVDHAAGTISGARVRDASDVWYRLSSGAQATRVLSTTGSEIVRPEGDRAPNGVAYESWEFINPRGDRVHGFLVTPDGEGPYPLVIDIHGGPAWLWLDSFSPEVQAWVDHGFAVALINYRGSTGYGAGWRDMLIGDPGLPELEDTLAGLDDLLRRRIADPERVVVSGASWGGYLTLLAIGRQPERWAAAVAVVPVADYVAAFEDEAPSLQAMDRALFGADPDGAPDLYRERSPITYIDRVKTPLLILAGENDSRCPIRQIDNYVEAMRERGMEPEVYRYATGHASFVVEERVRQMSVMLEFVLRHIATRRAGTI